MRLRDRASRCGFFGGWDYASDDALSPNFAEIGYRKGVPMGGDLVLPSEGAAPSFLLRAVKDPDGANLDRVQVVKGWRDAKGELHEKVHDVAWSGDRARTDDGKLPAVGSTVDVKAASYLNSIGSPSLVTTWTDPGHRSGRSRVLLRAGSSRYRRRAGRPTTRSSTALRRSSRPLPP